MISNQEINFKKQRKKEKHKEWVAANKEKILKTHKIWYEKNKEIIRKYAQNNKAKRAKHNLKYRLNNKHAINSKLKIYRKQPLVKLAIVMRAMVLRFCRLTNTDKDLHSNEYIGCNKLQLKEYLEKQFKPGMSWENHGEWHIDHIKPITAFKEHEIMKANHYTNLQPLWREENLRKRNNYPYRINK